jgi:hypothetical protein
MRSFLLIIIVLYFPVSGFSQSISGIKYDTLNKRDDQGKKTGYWVELLSKDFMVVKKEKKAVFFRYVYFQNDIRFETVIVPRKPNKHLVKIEGNTPVEGEVILLNGVYSIYNQKTNRLIKQFEFRQGHLINLLELYNNEETRLRVNYEKKYEGYGYSCFFTSYSEEGKVLLNGYNVLKEGKMKFINKK